MLFDDLATLNTIINYGRSDMKYKEDHDPEVDRLYNSSPPILEQCMQYEMARVFGKNNTAEEDSLEIEAESIEIVVEDKAAVLIRKLGPSVSMENCFRPIPLPSSCKSASLSEDGSEPRKNFSALSDLLAMSIRNGGGNSNTTQLTIYLPNYESMNLHVAETSNFDEILKAILEAHQGEKLHPVLYYYAPEFYVMRMHEGDGEPDMDFPAIDKTMKLKAFNLNEFCLCTASDDAMPPPPPPPPLHILGPVANRPVSVRSMPQHVHGTSALNRKSPPPQMISESYVSEKSSHTPGMLSRQESFVVSDTVTITIPNAGTCSVRIDESTTLGDLLPRIARTHRLRLFSDEYAFVISPEDQARLKIMSPITDLNQCVQSLGVRDLELQKRIYADSVKISFSSKVPGTNSAAATAKVALVAARTDLEHIVYTDTTAAVYQEWNVTKKNKFGRKQERVLGVDGKKVYNSKRDKYSRSAQGVHRAQRYISSIRKVEILDNDRKTLRITWEDEREVYDIEYTCDTKRDCVEIAAKILFLISPSTRKSNNAR